MTAHRKDAAFYRTALLLGLVRGDEVIRWAEDMLGSDDGAADALAEIITTPADDLTRLRQHLEEITLRPLATRRRLPTNWTRCTTARTKSASSPRRSRAR